MQTQYELAVAEAAEQSERCDQHPAAEIVVEFDAVHRVLVCRCAECDKIADEFEE